MINVVKKAWIPLLIVVVVAVAGFTVHRIRGFFGAEGIIVTPKVFADDPEPFDPKVVKYDTAHELRAANHRSAPDDLESDPAEPIRICATLIVLTGSGVHPSPPAAGAKAPHIGAGPGIDNRCNFRLA